MWIFLSDAFLSVVADKNDPNGPRLLVRSRRSGDIERVFPEASTFRIPDSDYAFRAWLPRQRVAAAISNQVESIDYPNFKDSISDDAYHDAALEAWSAMVSYQEQLDC
jgi:hypothetical protein